MKVDFEALFGPQVGQGSQATVYAKGRYAVKLYRADYPKTSVFSEAYIMANLERVNFPGPRVHEVLLAHGRYGLRMDLVQGKMMSEWLRIPEKCKETLDTLVDLQCRLQKFDIAWAPDLKQRFKDDLERNAGLTVDDKKKFGRILDELPDGRALCHCDFHSGNVFFDGSEYTVIDLLQVSRGDPAADAACSYVSYTFIQPDLAEYYLNRYCAVSGISEKCVRQWLAVYAATLLGQVPEHLAGIIDRFIAMDEDMK